MTGHGSTSVHGRIRPDRVVGALPDRLAAVCAEVRFEVAPLQAARSIVIASTWPPPIGGSRPSSR
jgi:hypothetical protein